MDARDKKYNLWARKYPAIISLTIPIIFLLLVFQEQAKELSDAKYIVNLIVSATSILPATFFLYTFLLRDIAKVFPEKLFKAIRYPTRYLLSADSDTFDDTLKQTIKDEIKNQFNIEILNTNEANKATVHHTIDKAVSLIREKTRDNNILFEFNCIYGFYRNMTAGFMLDTLLVIVIDIYNPAHIPTNILTPLTILISILTLLCLLLSYINGRRYAKRLYTVFISKIKKNYG